MAKAKADKTFFGRLFASIASIFGSIFKPVFEGAKETYDNLPEEQKEALKHGAGIIDYINRAVGQAPEDVEKGILTTFPNLDLPKLTDGLMSVCKGFNIKVDVNTIPEMIAKIQKHLSKLEGSLWETIIQGAANVVALLLSPKGTRAGAVSSLMEYVYRTFFAKNKK